MTKLLEKVFSRVSGFSVTEQNALARWLMEELASEERWQKTLKSTPGLLDDLADEAIVEHRKGKTKSLLLRSL